MQANFYITNGNCGLKFNDEKERDTFWNGMAANVLNGFCAQQAAERIGQKTIRFYPGKTEGKGGFEWPMVAMVNGAAANEAQPKNQNTPKPAPAPAPVAAKPPETITTANPFEKLATNPNRPLPGLCPPVPSEMLAVQQPITVSEVAEVLAPPATIEEVTISTELPKEPEPVKAVDDPEPQKPEAHHRSKIFQQWKKEHDDWKARQKS